MLLSIMLSTCIEVSLDYDMSAKSSYKQVQIYIRMSYMDISIVLNGKNVKFLTSTDYIKKYICVWVIVS